MTQPVALVTGGSRGIGAAIAAKLAEDGFDIAVTYASNATAAAQVVATIEALGRRAVAIQADGATTHGNIAAVTQTVATLGRLDILVCNAGIYPYGPIGEMTGADRPHPAPERARGDGGNHGSRQTYGVPAAG
jgi:NAD(P)-dependent dehydrogenase (short-subunit alcohol dehydrogenase family)